jgi:periplasmic copper chaperone A
MSQESGDRSQESKFQRAAPDHSATPELLVPGSWLVLNSSLMSWPSVPIPHLLLLFFCCVSRTAFADDAPVKVEDAWLQAVPPVADATAAYMRIRNLSQSPIKLTGASSSIAPNIELMITTRHPHNGQEIMGMEKVDTLEIPPGGILELKPGGNHLMIMGLTSHPKEGERIKLTVQFAPGDQRIDVQIPVFKQEPK